MVAKAIVPMVLAFVAFPRAWAQEGVSAAASLCETGQTTRGTVEYIGVPKAPRFVRQNGIIETNGDAFVMGTRLMVARGLVRDRPDLGAIVVDAGPTECFVAIAGLRCSPPTAKELLDGAIELLRTHNIENRELARLIAGLSVARALADAAENRETEPLVVAEAQELQASLPKPLIADVQRSDSAKKNPCWSIPTWGYTAFEEEQRARERGWREDPNSSRKEAASFDTTKICPDGSCRQLARARRTLPEVPSSVPPTGAGRAWVMENGVGLRARLSDEQSSGRALAIGTPVTVIEIVGQFAKVAVEQAWSAARLGAFHDLGPTAVPRVFRSVQPTALRPEMLPNTVGYVPVHHLDSTELTVSRVIQDGEAARASGLFDVALVQMLRAEALDPANTEQVNRVFAAAIDAGRFSLAMNYFFRRPDVAADRYPLSVELTLVYACRGDLGRAAPVGGSTPNWFSVTSFDESGDPTVDAQFIPLPDDACWMKPLPRPCAPASAASWRQSVRELRASFPSKPQLRIRLSNGATVPFKTARSLFVYERSFAEDPKASSPVRAIAQLPPTVVPSRGTVEYWIEIEDDPTGLGYGVVSANDVATARRAAQEMPVLEDTRIRIQSLRGPVGYLCFKGEDNPCP